MRGGIFAACAVPIAALLLVVGGAPDTQQAVAEAQDIDRALAQAEADLARAKADAGRSDTGA